MFFSGQLCRSQTPACCMTTEHVSCFLAEEHRCMLFAPLFLLVMVYISTLNGSTIVRFNPSSTSTRLYASMCRFLILRPTYSGWTWGCALHASDHKIFILRNFDAFLNQPKASSTKNHQPTGSTLSSNQSHQLGGGFKYLLFSSLFGEDEPKLTSIFGIFFKGVGSTTN